MLGTIDAKWLKGLTYKTSEAKKVKDDNGKTKTSWIPVERALKPDDVLAVKDKGATVVIVAKDGRKHGVEKEAAETAKGKKGGDGGA